MVQCLPWQGEDQHCSWTVTSEYKDEKKDIPCGFPSQQGATCLTHRGSFSQPQKGHVCISCVPGCGNSFVCQWSTWMCCYGASFCCLFCLLNLGRVDLSQLGSSTTPEHSVCPALQAAVVSWPFGRNLYKCVLFFPLPKLFQTSLLFYFISRCRSLLLPACSLVVAPASLGCSLSAPLLLHAALWTCFSPVHEWSSSTVRPLSPFSAESILPEQPLAAFASQMPALTQICCYTN